MSLSEAIVWTWIEHKVNILGTEWTLKRISNATHTHFKRTSTRQTYLKINKFTKSSGSRGVIPRFGVLVTNSIITNQKSALEMTIRPS